MPGDFEFTLDVTPLEGEQQLENNAQSRLVSVREEKVRVLLVASTPSYEYRFLKHMLERDSTVDVRYDAASGGAGWAIGGALAIVAALLGLLLVLRPHPDRDAEPAA